MRVLLRFSSLAWGGVFFLYPFILPGGLGKTKGVGGWGLGYADSGLESMAPGHERLIR